MTSSRHEHVLDGAHAENVGSRGAVDIAARGLVHQGYCRRTGKPAHQCFHQGHIASLVRDNRSLSMTEDRPAAYGEIPYFWCDNATSFLQINEIRGRARPGAGVGPATPLSGKTAEVKKRAPGDPGLYFVSELA
jgi:hypothetical protein